MSSPPCGACRMGWAEPKPVNAPDLPMALAPVPLVEPVGEPVVGKGGQPTQARQAHQSAEPAGARRPPPYLDGAIGADIQATIGVDVVKPTTHVLDAGPEAVERRRREVDVAKFDGAGLRGADEPIALPGDAGIADRASGVVPDREPGRSHRNIRRCA